MPRHTLHVISHTHWDREWYLTFQQFRVRLVDMMDNLLKILETDPDYKYFNMDGQTIILEDYLEIRPEKRELIQKYAREGRLVVGPWYVLNDEHLVSGESTIRSLLLGHEMTAQFGPVMKVGYLPDQFGNISQMPQILRGFGIDNAIFGRGLQLEDGRKMEFIWRSPDGSEVLGSLMAFWYNNAQRIPSNDSDAVEYLQGIVDRMAPVSLVDQLLLMNGVDHLEAQPDVGQIIARVDGKADGWSLKHSTLPGYVRAVQETIERKNLKPETICGELREDRRGSVLAGTLSSRMYIKQANEACQTSVEKYAELFASLAYTLGTPYPDGMLNYVWKLLMHNHPHDSICGCSIDQVHREMMPRFDQVRQVADELTSRALSAIAQHVKTDDDSIVVFNPLNWVRTDRIKITVDFQMSEATRETPVADPARGVEWISLVDENGQEPPHSVLCEGTVVKQILDPHELPMVALFRRFEVELLATDVPACGYRTYRIVRGKTPAKDSSSPLIVGDLAIANEYVRVSVVDDSVRLERLSTNGEPVAGEAYPDIGAFEDGGDVGDEYLYVRPANDSFVTELGSRPSFSIVDISPVSATLKMEADLRLPESANADSTGRAARLVTCPVTVCFRVTRGVPRVDITTSVDNQARDHRLRTLFRTFAGPETASAESQFDVVERPVGIRDEWPGAASFYPQLRWMDIDDGERGLCVINKGLPEYEVYADEVRTVALTLLRCIPRLSGSANAPGAQDTPEAQCIGQHNFDYALYPHEGNWEQSRVWMQAHQHNVALIAIQTGSHDGVLPPRMSFVENSHPELVVSAIKRAHRGKDIVVRLYNTSTRDISGGWVRVRGAKSAEMLNMNEEPQPGRVEFRDGAANIDAAAKKIVTLGFKLDD